MKDNLSGGALTETTLLILLGFLKSNYGYGVMQWIKDKTNGRVILGMGTLYGAINHLIEKTWLQMDRKEDRRVFYKITDLGYEQVMFELNRLESLVKIAKEQIE